VSEWILDGRSTQIGGYAVPFTSVHAGKLYSTEDKLKTLQKLNITRKSKQHKNTAKQN